MVEVERLGSYDYRSAEADGNRTHQAQAWLNLGSGVAKIGAGERVHASALCPHQESNLDARFRKPPLCPLSYGGWGRSLQHQRTVRTSSDGLMMINGSRIVCGTPVIDQANLVP